MLMITVVNVSTICSLPTRCQVLCQGVCIRYHLSPRKAVLGWGYHSICIDERGLGGGLNPGFSDSSAVYSAVLSAFGGPILCRDSRMYSYTKLEVT